jgi:hypothetical protein
VDIGRFRETAKREKIPKTANYFHVASHFLTIPITFLKDRLPFNDYLFDATSQVSPLGIPHPIVSNSEHLII